MFWFFERLALFLMLLTPLTLTQEPDSAEPPPPVEPSVDVPQVAVPVDLGSGMTPDPAASATTAAVLIPITATTAGPYPMIPVPAPEQPGPAPMPEAMVSETSSLPGLAPAPDGTEWGPSDLEAVLMAIKNLSSLQGEVMEQQRVYQEERQAHKKVLDERETFVLKTLEDQRGIIKIIQDRVSRKLRTVSKAKKAAEGFGAGGYGLNGGSKDCADVYLNGGDDVSGIYKVFPTWDAQNPFRVFCDMDTDGGGWTVIQRRGNFGLADDYFQKTWNEYKNGFGDLETEFWLGNERVWQLTNQGAYQIRFDLREEDPSASRFALYQSFWIESESQSYRLHVGKFDPEGNSSDIFVRNNEQEFATKDHNRGGGGCAGNIHGRGWWFNSHCDLSPKMGNPRGGKQWEQSREYRPSQQSRERYGRSWDFQDQSREFRGTLQELVGSYRTEAEGSGGRSSSVFPLTELKIRPVRFLANEEGSSSFLGKTSAR